MALHTPAAAWSEGLLALRAGVALQESRRLELTAAMRPLRLQEVFELVGAAIRTNGADVVKLGHWPRLVGDGLAQATHRHREFIVALRHLCRAWAPKQELTCVQVCQRDGCRHREVGWNYPALEIFTDGSRAWAYLWHRRAGEAPHFEPLFEQAVDLPQRQLRVTLGRMSGACHLIVIVKTKLNGIACGCAHMTKLWGDV